MNQHNFNHEDIPSNYIPNSQTYFGQITNFFIDNPMKSIVGGVSILAITYGAARAYAAISYKHNIEEKLSHLQYMGSFIKDHAAIFGSVEVQINIECL